MKVWTAHEKPFAPPELVPEGFSIGATVFGPLWLAAHRAWLPAGGTLLLVVLIPALASPPASMVLMIGIALLIGLSGRDLVRWCLTRRGYILTGIVAGRTEDDARSRLLEFRPDLVVRSLTAEAAPL